MTLFRNIHTKFWTDTFIIDLEFEEKSFYLYLLTNPLTSACGIYEISKRTMINETGLSKDKINLYLNKLIDCNKIKYSEEFSEVYIINFLKYNSNNSPNTIKCITKELEKVKNQEFIKQLQAPCKGLGSGLKLLGSPLQGASIKNKNEIEQDFLVEAASITIQDFDKEKEKEKENDTKKENDKYTDKENDTSVVLSEQDDDILSGHDNIQTKVCNDILSGHDNIQTKVCNDILSGHDNIQTKVCNDILSGYDNILISLEEEQELKDTIINLNLLSYGIKILHDKINKGTIKSPYNYKKLILSYCYKKIEYILLDNKLLYKKDSNTYISNKITGKEDTVLIIEIDKMIMNNYKLILGVLEEEGLI